MNSSDLLMRLNYLLCAILFMLITDPCVLAEQKPITKESVPLDQKAPNRSVDAKQWRAAMTIENLFEFDRVSEMDLSPDGKEVVYQITDVDLSANQSKTTIWLAATDGSSKPFAITNSGKKDSRPRFSPDGKTILFQSNRSGSLQLWAIDRSGGEAVQLTTICTEASQGVWSPDGLKIAFVSSVSPEFSHLPFAESEKANKDRIAKQEADGGAVRTAEHLFFRHWDSYVGNLRQHLFVIEIVRDPGGKLKSNDPVDVTPADRDACPTSMTFSSSQDFCFSADGSHLIFTAVPGGKQKASKKDALNGSPDADSVIDRSESWSTDYDLCLASVKRPATVSSEYEFTSLTSANLAADSGPKISRDGRSIAWRAQAISGYEADRWRLYVSKIAADGLLQGDPINLCSDLDISINDFTWFDDHSIQAVVDYRAQNALLKFSAVKSMTASELKTQLQPFTARGSFEGGTITGLATHAASGTTAYLLSRFDQPPEIYFQSQAGSLTNISRANSERLQTIDWGSIESVDAVDIEGHYRMQMWIIKPPKFDPAKKYPVVYLVHGGPQGAWENGWSNRWCPQLWAAQGYIIVMPNPRGSTGFGHEFVEQISGDWGGKCYRDLMTGADYVESLPYVDKKRIAAAGASFGGYMMNWFAVNTSRFCCLVTHCSVWNFESMWGTTDELWFDEYEHGGLPWQYPERYREFSPHIRAGALSKYKTPMLVIHNDLDFRCPIGQGLELFTALQRQSVPSRLVNFTNEGHWVLQPSNSNRWHEEVFGWLKRYCMDK